MSAEGWIAVEVDVEGLRAPDCSFCLTNPKHRFLHRIAFPRPKLFCKVQQIRLL